MSINFDITKNATAFHRNDRQSRLKLAIFRWTACDNTGFSNAGLETFTKCPYH